MCEEELIASFTLWCKAHLIFYLMDRNKSEKNIRFAFFSKKNKAEGKTLPFSV